MAFWNDTIKSGGQLPTSQGNIMPPTSGIRQSEILVTKLILWKQAPPLPLDRLSTLIRVELSDADVANIVVKATLLFSSFGYSV